MVRSKVSVRKLIPQVDGINIESRRRAATNSPNNMPRAARKHGAPVNEPRMNLGGGRPRKTRISKEQRQRNIRQKFKDSNFSLTKPLDHCLETLDAYIKRHLTDCEPIYLRQLLRTLHGLLPAGDHKRIIRGTLQMFTRWEISKIWQRVTKLMQIISEDLKINSFETPKKIPLQRIVTPLIALRECVKPANRELVAVVNEKLIRIRSTNLTMENN